MAGWRLPPEGEPRGEGPQPKEYEMDRPDAGRRENRRNARRRVPGLFIQVFHEFVKIFCKSCAGRWVKTDDSVPFHRGAPPRERTAPPPFPPHVGAVVPDGPEAVARRRQERENAAEAPA